MTMLAVHLLFWLFVMHALCDIPLQPDRLRLMKRRRAPEGSEGRWLMGLACHALVHAGGVALVTGSVALGCCEMVAHALIDHAKSEGAFGLKVDQTLHAGCKVLWTMLAIGFISNGGQW